MEKDELFADATLAEYSALREEMARILERQYSIANWAISSIAIIAAAMANSWGTLVKAPLFLLSFFFFVIPTLVTAYVVAWSHIIIKMARLGAHLFLVERKMSILVYGKSPFGTPQNPAEALIKMPLAWEHSLWASHSHGFIHRTVRLIRWAMLGLYAAMCIIGTGVALWMGKGGMAHSMRFLAYAALGIPYVFWGAAWYLIFRYIAGGVNDATAQETLFATASQDLFRTLGEN